MTLGRFHVTTDNSVEAMIVGMDHPIVYITVQGPPLVQKRSRVRVLGRGHPVVYDPSRRSKWTYKQAIRNAMADLGTTDFPFFQGRKLKLTVTFALTNQAKDVDNLLKFVMDACEKVLYKNNALIWEAAEKKITVASAEQFTQIQVEELL